MGPTTASTVSKNFIYNLSVSASSTAASIYGICIAAGAATYSNNIISLGGNTQTILKGISETGASGTTNNLYFNTVYIGGTVASGSNKSYALFSAVATNTRDFRNNIFMNARSTTGGSSLHYAMYFITSGGALTCDYNDYLVSGTGGMLGGFYYGGDKSTLPIVTGQDAHSLNVNPTFPSPDANGTFWGDFKPGVSLPGVSETGITTDYSGWTRTVPPTIGGINYDNPLPVTLQSFYF